MMDVRRLLDGVLGSGVAAGLEKEARRRLGGSVPSSGGKSGGGFGGGMLGGAAAGGLMSMVLGSKKGRKMGGKALKYGGAALLAGLAWKAWSDWKGGKAAQGTPLADVVQAPPAHSGFAPDEETDGRGEDFRLALVRAMIAAAKCDGHIDAEEHGRITAAISDQSLTAEEKGFLLDAFTTDADPMAIARLARTQEQGAELYAASRLAIDPDVPAEHQYLSRLSAALGLPPALVEHLDAKIESARAEAGAE
ncbi:MAG: tellurite resistance TerB family protein [Caenispirillum sp.]|nr:tellurite resistance TerB family protein [Caenispirillum sp.]